MTDFIPPRDQAYFDIFVTAIEGGINYWAEVSKYIWTDDSGHEDPIGFHATIHDIDADLGDEGLEITRATIAKGVGKYVDWAKDHSNGYLREAARCMRYGKWDDLDIDAEIADAILQFGALGELTYG